jgi:hypothetical protein
MHSSLVAVGGQRMAMLGDERQATQVWNIEAAGG